MTYIVYYVGKLTESLSVYLDVSVLVWQDELRCNCFGMKSDGCKYKLKRQQMLTSTSVKQK